LQSISDGIRGNKGNVHLEIGNIINFHTDSYEACSDQISSEIKALYKLHPTNYAAAIIQGKEIDKYDFDSAQIDQSIQFLKNKIKAIPEEMHPYLLNQYSNPIL